MITAAILVYNGSGFREIAMKCEECRQKIKNYITNSMNLRDMETFLGHIKECPDCYDELETYYTIHAGIKYLEEDRTESYNIAEMFEADIAQKEKNIRRYRIIKGGCLVVGAVVAVRIILLLFWGV